MDTEFIEGNQDLLDWISPLWTKLNAYHRRKSRQFVVYYNQLTFQQRKAVLIAKAQNGLMRVELVRLKEADNYFAYSVTTITATHEGEIESLYVDEPFRRMGIGKDLMTRSLEWLDRHKVKVKRLAVAGGNEETIDFYQRFGFYPKLTQLEQADQFHVINPDGNADTKNGTKRPHKKK